MPGVNVKPTAMKLLQGNPGKRPLNDAEPMPARGAVMPDYFKAEPALVSEWKRHAERLEPLGLLTVLDAEALAALCVLSLRFQAMAEGGSSGGMLAKVSMELRALWARFGMTPGDRARVKVAKPATNDPFAEFDVGARR